MSIVNTKYSQRWLLGKAHVGLWFFECRNHLLAAFDSAYQQLEVATLNRKGLSSPELRPVPIRILRNPSETRRIEHLARVRLPLSVPRIHFRAGR